MLACRCLQSKDQDRNKSQLMDHGILLVGCVEKQDFVVELAIHTTCIPGVYIHTYIFCYWNQTFGKHQPIYLGLGFLRSIDKYAIGRVDPLFNVKVEVNGWKLKWTNFSKYNP